jgi:hypothetical protein
MKSEGVEVRRASWNHPSSPHSACCALAGLFVVSVVAGVVSLGVTWKFAGHGACRTSFCHFNSYVDKY